MRLFSVKELPEIGMYIFLWYFTVISTVSTDTHSPKLSRQVSRGRIENDSYYTIRKFLQNTFTKPNEIQESRMLQIAQPLIPKSTKFFCDTNGTRSLTRPTSVHKLRPGDIDVIGSLGDSLTVATGSFSYTIPQLLVDHRGTSFSAGGQGTWREFLTLPNIIKEFNPKLVGYAYGDSLPQDRYSQLNVAEVGAFSRDVLFMTRELVKRIKTDRRININEDWKLITLMISPNTHCSELCLNDHTVYAERRRKEIMSSFLYIKENLPRTIINFIISINIEYVYIYKNLPPVCYITRIVGCPCLFATQNKNRLHDYVNVITMFQKIDKEIAESEVLKDKDDFAVVLQTATEHLQMPMNRFNSTDLSYLASDCFHFSQKGYARLANALWNNMMEPVGRKSTNWSKEFDRFLCPTEEFPYIRTWKNSIT